jgi:hypothetical protein
MRIAVIRNHKQPLPECQRTKVKARVLTEQTQVLEVEE